MNKELMLHNLGGGKVVAKADLYFTLTCEDFLDSKSNKCFGFSLKYSAGSISPQFFELKTDVFTGQLQFNSLYYNLSTFFMTSNVGFGPSQVIPPDAEGLAIITFIAREDIKKGYFCTIFPTTNPNQNYLVQVDNGFFNKNSPILHMSLFVTEGTKDEHIPLGYSRFRNR